MEGLYHIHFRNQEGCEMKENKAILVSICCTTYNHEKYIKQALDSFLEQNVQFNYEICIHDDASTDSTPQILLEYQNKYPQKINLILQKENQTQKGIKKISYVFNHTRARGKYIAFCEGDDYWTDCNKLQKQIEFMEKNNDFSMTFHSSKIVNTSGEKTGKLQPFPCDKEVSTDEIIYGGGGICPTASITYRKECFNNPPQFYFDSPVGDYPMQIILASKGKVFYFNKEMSAYRKVLSESASWSFINNSKEKKLLVYKGLELMLKEFNNYTNYQYMNAVLKAIRLNDIELNILNRNFWGLLNKGVREEIKKMPFSKKIKLITRISAPRFYEKLLKRKYK